MAEVAASSDIHLTELVSNIYDAALGAVPWPEIVRQVMSSVGSPTAHLYVYDSSQGDLAELAIVGFEPKASDIAPFADRFIELSPCTAALRKGDIGVTSIEDRRTNVFYNEFLRQVGTCHVLASRVLSERGRSWIFAAGRPESRDPFGHTEIELLEHLLPHLRRAMAVHASLEGASRKLRLSEAALDEINQSIFGLDEMGRVITANKSARAQLQARDGLGLGRDGRLRGLHLQERRALEASIARALTGVGATLTLRGAAGLRQYTVRVLPTVSEPSPWASPRTSVLVFVTAHRDEGPPKLDDFARFHDLSRAELGVLSLLVANKTPREISEALHVSMPTVRAHLRSLYRRTQTRGQTELVALALRTSGQG